MSARQKTFAAKKMSHRMLAEIDADLEQVCLWYTHCSYNSVGDRHVASSDTRALRCPDQMARD